jgi:SAM-dependent methyltransferase
MLLCPQCSHPFAVEMRDSCLDCGWKLSYVREIPVYFSDSDRSGLLMQDYANNYERLAEKNLRESNIDRKFLKNQALNIIRYLGDVSGRRICDVGIGQGFLANELLQRGVGHLTAIDVSVSYLEKFVNTERVRPAIANAENLPFSEEFDIVVSTDVMEHVLNVGSFLYSLNRMLRFDGVACVRVPYREGLLNYSPHMNYEHAFGHMRSFNKDLLRLYFEQAGFADVSFKFDGFSIGTPQPYLYDAVWKKRIYNKLALWLERRLNHPADITLWNSYFARLIMRPVEIVVLARKTVNISG